MLLANPRTQLVAGSRLLLQWFTEHGKSFLISVSAAEQARSWTGYVLGKPEDLTSRFAGADLLSLVTRVLATAQAARAQGMSEESIVAFLENSFAASQRSLQAAARPWDRDAIVRTIHQLAHHGLVCEGPGGYQLTPLGRLSGEVGVVVESVVRLSQALRGVAADQLNEVALLAATQVTVELDDVLIPVHRKSHQERHRWRVALESHQIPYHVLEALHHTARDYAEHTARCKRTAAVLYWVDGMPLNQMEAKLLQHCRDSDAAGAIRSVADRTRDLLPTAARVAEILHDGLVDHAQLVDDLLVRLEFGIPQRVVPLARILGTQLGRGDYLALSLDFSIETFVAKGRDDLLTALRDKHKVGLLLEAQAALSEELAAGRHCARVA